MVDIFVDWKVGFMRLPQQDRMTHCLERIMRKRDFLGKTASVQRLEDIDAVVYPPGDFSDELTVAEVFLSDFECGATDSSGRNGYSIDLYLDQENRIVKVVRTGHLHMCGGQGSDDDLNRFPYQTLEAEADSVLADILK